MDLDAIAVTTLLMAMLNSIAWMTVTLLVLAARGIEQPASRLTPARARRRAH